MSGDLIEINPRAAETYGLALHELATNAVKYGALSTPDGWVELTFALDPDAQTYRFSWREQGGPPVDPPERNGFGVCVLTRTAPQSINGESCLEFPQEGLTYTLSRAAVAGGDGRHGVATVEIRCVQRDDRSRFEGGDAHRSLGLMHSTLRRRRQARAELGIRQFLMDGDDHEQARKNEGEDDGRGGHDVISLFSI